MSTSDILRELGDPGLLSIGHSNHPFDDLVALLEQHRVEVVADVRTSPYSRYNPQFNSQNLRHGLGEAGIRYLFLGKELGGRPEGEEFYDSDPSLAGCLVFYLVRGHTRGGCFHYIRCLAPVVGLGDGGFVPGAGVDSDSGECPGL